MKGKYGARAALRREDESVQSEIETYQQAVKRLTDDNKKLTETLTSERAARKEEVRRLNAQLDEGLSPEVLALRSELERQREKAETAKADARNTGKLWQATFTGLRSLLTDGLGLTAIEATEVILFLNPEHRRVGDPLIIADPQLDTRPKAALTREKALAIQTAKGYRSRTDIVKLLKDKVDSLAAS